MADEHETQTQESLTEQQDQGKGGVKSPLSLLADSLYGPPPSKAEPPEDTHETDDAVPQEAAGNSETGSQEGQEAETEEVELSSLEELAEHFELDPEWLKHLKVSEKVNGQPIEVSISEALATHRKVKAGDSYLAEAKEKAKAIAEEASQQKEQLTATIATFSKLLETAEQEINRDAQNINWTKLREDDPAEYSAKKEEIRERRERLEAMKREAGQSYHQAVALQQQKVHENLQQYVAIEHEKLAKAIPEIADEEKGKPLKGRIAEDLLARGFSQAEVAQAYDSRLVVMAYEAMLYRQGKAKLETAKKRVVKVPKVLKPGSKSKEPPKPNGASKNDRVSILYG